MFKMDSHDPFGHFKHKLWPKERSRITLISFPAGGVQHTVGKLSTWLQLYFRAHLNRRFARKVMRPPKLRDSQLWEFQDFHLGVPRQNDIWVLVPWPSTKYIIRGKVVASPKFGPWWLLWVRICPWLIRAPKVFQLCTNQLDVWFM